MHIGQTTASRPQHPTPHTPHPPGQRRENKVAAEIVQERTLIKDFIRPNMCWHILLNWIYEDFHEIIHFCGILEMENFMCPDSLHNVGIILSVFAIE